MERLKAVGRAMTAYAELQCTSCFSFLRGASHPEELVERAAALGHVAVGIADENTLAGMVRAHVAAKRCGIKLIVGSRLTPADGPSVSLYAPDRAAYGRLSRLITLGRRRAPKGQCVLTMADVLEGGAGLLAVVHAPGRMEDSFIESGAAVRRAFAGRCYLAVSRGFGPDDGERLRELASAGQAMGLPLLAVNDVHYHVPERRALQDVLTCIRAGCTIAQAGGRLFVHAERHLKSGAEMARLLREAPGAVARAVELADRCTFSLDELRYEYPEELTPPGVSATAHLAALTWAGAAERFAGGVPAPVRGQIERELRLIAELGYEAYFLTVHDVVRFARSRGILCQGRGSAANSAVCYCLGITSVDPSRIGLLFERFVSRERNEPPDIDVDFEHERREEVIQYIYGKYGRERTGLTAEVICYRRRSAVREVGKALGLSLDCVDRLAKDSDRWDGELLSESHLARSGLRGADATLGWLTKLARELMGFPRHLSQHVGGFVMTQGPLCELVPIQNAAMADRTVIEWNKDDIDALGILKVDVLGLGMLTCIRKSFELLERHHGRALSLATVPAEDPAVYEMCCRADTVGVFQIESRGQMSMLPRLRPRNFYDLVIEVAILRPGPIQGDMVHPFLRRRNGIEPVTYPNEAVRSVLEKTLGVPLFQEQVMRLAIVAAGFTGGEADRLRRAMAAFRSQGELEQFYRRFMDGMAANGYDRSFAERLFDQIRGFGAYGFPESHAASFALLVYVSAWLKRYYPAAFAAALLNSQPMGFYAPAQIVRDAREHGVSVRPVDVNHSEWDCTLETGEEEVGPRWDACATEDFQHRRNACATECGGAGAGGAEADPSTWGRGGPALRLGLRMVKGLPREAARRLTVGRPAGGYGSMAELSRASGLSRGSLERLARADAFGSLGLERRGALWAILGRGRSAGEMPLFERLADGGAWADNETRVEFPAMPLGQRILYDYDMVGLSLEAHPVSLARAELARRGRLTAAALRDAPNGRWVGVAGLVICRQRPETAGGVLFITLEDETGAANVIVRPEVFERDRGACLHAVLLEVRGRVSREGAVINVVASRADDASGLLPAVLVASRDFR